jgi:hypothetical protein
MFQANTKIVRALSLWIAALSVLATAAASLQGVYRDNAFVTTTWLGNDTVTLFWPSHPAYSHAFGCRIEDGNAGLVGCIGLYALQLRLLSCSAHPSTSSSCFTQPCWRFPSSP